MNPKEYMLRTQADLFHMWSMLITCGVPILETVRICGEEFDDYTVEMGSIYRSLEEGRDLSDTFLDVSYAFHHGVHNLIVLADETGELEIQLMEASKLVRKEAGLPEKSTSVPGPQAQFYTALFERIEEGDSMDMALRTLLNRCLQFPPKKILNDIVHLIYKGMSAAEAMSRHRKLFPSYAINALTCVNIGHSVYDVTKALAEYVREREFLRAPMSDIRPY